VIAMSDGRIVDEAVLTGSARGRSQAIRRLLANG
jgi:hypothetical protein